MENPVDKARDIIRVNRYMSLATSDGTSVWIAPLAYVVDESYTFYWYSAVDARHSQHIRVNPQAAAAIFNSTEPSDIVDGLQIAGTAQEVEEAKLPQIMDLYWKQSFPDEDVRAQWMRPIEDFSGDAIQRFYGFSPTHIYKIDPSSMKVDRRLEIDIMQLCQEPVHS